MVKKDASFEIAPGSVAEQEAASFLSSKQSSPNKLLNTARAKATLLFQQNKKAPVIFMVLIVVGILFSGTSFLSKHICN